MAWAEMHPVDCIFDAATICVPGVAQSGLTVAGPGAPLIAEFAVAEFASALGLSTAAGQNFLGHAVELRYRLPRLWRAVMAGSVAVWRARRVAEATGVLSREAAGFVDGQVAAVGGRIGPAQLSRLVEVATARFMPAAAEELAERAWDTRQVRVEHDQVSFIGTTRIEAEVDLADAVAFDRALSAGAARLAELGSLDTLDGRRATAVGDLARAQLGLDLGASESAARRGAGEVVLYVHLSEAAVSGTAEGLAVARVENVRRAVLAEQVRGWCATPGVRVVVKPVLDLAGHVRVDQWEVPDRIAEQVIVRDGCCVFPWCTRPARTCRLQNDPEKGCDLDHRVPHATGGVTCACNLAPLCRRHHRLKTHAGWTYTSPELGTYLWVSPHGYLYLRDHRGTLDLTHDPGHDPPPPRAAPDP